MISWKDWYHIVGSNKTGSIENSEEHPFVANVSLFFYLSFHINIIVCIFFFTVMYVDHA